MTTKPRQFVSVTNEAVFPVGTHGTLVKRHFAQGRLLWDGSRAGTETLGGSAGKRGGLEAGES